MSSIYLELLDNQRKNTFEKLKIFNREATLAGGTALCLQIGHRLSFDFDLFLERKIKRADYLKLKRIFQINLVRINTEDQLTVVTKEDVGITLVYYPFKPLFPKTSTEFLPLFSVKDIAADKAYTIGRRAVWRDYVDLFFILELKYLTILEVVNLAEKKFGVEFNPKLFLEQLIFFEDLEFPKISFVKKEYSITEIQNFFKQQIEWFEKTEFKI